MYEFWINLYNAVAMINGLASGALAVFFYLGRSDRVMHGLFVFFAITAIAFWGILGFEHFAGTTYTIGNAAYTVTRRFMFGGSQMIALVWLMWLLWVKKAR